MLWTLPVPIIHQKFFLAYANLVSINNSCDIFNDEMVLIFFTNTIAKPHAKRLTDQRNANPILYTYHQVRSKKYREAV